MEHSLTDNLIVGLTGLCFWWFIKQLTKYWAASDKQECQNEWSSDLDDTENF